MGWKNWSYVKRGWVTGILLPLILIFIYWASVSIPCSRLVCITELFNIGGGGCDGCYYTMDWVASIIILFIPSFIFFLIGSLIGYIYGKIKNRGRR